MAFESNKIEMYLQKLNTYIKTGRSDCPLCGSPNIKYNGKRENNKETMNTTYCRDCQKRTFFIEKIKDLSCAENLKTEDIRYMFGTRGKYLNWMNMVFIYLDKTYYKQTGERLTIFSGLFSHSLDKHSSVLYNTKGYYKVSLDQYNRWKETITKFLSKDDIKGILKYYAASIEKSRSNDEIISIEENIVKSIIGYMLFEWEKGLVKSKI